MLPSYSWSTVSAARRSVTALLCPCLALAKTPALLGCVQWPHTAGDCVPTHLPLSLRLESWRGRTMWMAWAPAWRTIQLDLDFIPPLPSPPLSFHLVPRNKASRCNPGWPWTLLSLLSPTAVLELTVWTTLVRHCMSVKDYRGRNLGFFLVLSSHYYAISPLNLVSTYHTFKNIYSMCWDSLELQYLQPQWLWCSLFL